MTFGERLRMVRHERGLSMEKLADMIGAGKSLVLRWERDEIKGVGLNYLVELSKALNVSVNFLAGTEDRNGKPIIRATEIFAPIGEERKLVECYRAADAKGKARIMRIAEEEKAREDEFRAEERKEETEAEA